jgi:hypothetical protein
MNETAIVIIVGILTFLVSTGTTLIIVGVKWGRISGDVETLKQAAARWDQVITDVSVMKHDLAEIKGMFRLTIKE